MVCEHNFHFVSLESKNEHYIKNNECKIRDRKTRLAKFICDKCGLYKKVEIING